MKKIFVLLIFSLLIVPAAIRAQKQYNNTLRVGFSDFFYPKLQTPQFGLYKNILVEQSGLYYSRRIKKSVFINAGYLKWNINKKDEFASPLVPSKPEPTNPGGLQWRTEYKMIDLYLSYDYHFLKKHKLLMGLGASYCWGLNTYIDTVYYNPEPPFDAIMFSKIEPAHYWGMMPVFCYDYMLFNNRAAIGIDLRCRKYFGLYSSQIDYGIHVGVNF